MAGSEDKLAKLKDVEWIKSVLEEQGVLRKYVELKIGHNSFSRGKSMEYLEEHVIPFMLGI